MRFRNSIRVLIGLKIRLRSACAVKGKCIVGQTPTGLLFKVNLPQPIRQIRQLSFTQSNLKPFNFGDR